MGLSLAIVAALAGDAVLGEPRRGHPLAVFGALAERIERGWNRSSRAAGTLALLVVAGLPVLAIAIVVAIVPAGAGWVAAGVLAMLTIGRRSLKEHTLAVARPLAAGDLVTARQHLRGLVSRDTAAMDAVAVRRATLESVLENASDAVFASVFWFAVGGFIAGPAGAAGGVLAHRLINTLDAMWGYRTTRFEAFGWAAARADDVVNWLPARLSALVFAVTGHTRAALSCWRRQARTWISPNAGAVMAAGAGALRVRLGGGACYHGHWREQPVLGCGGVPVDGDIQRALKLIDGALAVVLALVVLGDWL